MTPDTTPATPEGYRAALALIDRYRFEDGAEASTAADMRAVFAVARADLEEQAMRQAHASAIMRARTNHDLRVARLNHEQATNAHDAAVAALCALAVGGAA